MGLEPRFVLTKLGHPFRAYHDADRPVSRVRRFSASQRAFARSCRFINDAAGVGQAPGWLKHAHAKDDAMTLPDIVFPAFLFIAGVSIPLAFSRAQAAGASRSDLFGKVLGRAFALLVMGVLMVNEESFSPWARGAWGALAYVAMLLAFAVVPPIAGRARTFWLTARGVGTVALLALAFTYTNKKGQHLLLGPLFDSTDTNWLRHSWWGILGLIGWAYLVASTLYLLFGRRREWLVGAAGLLMLLYVGTHTEMAARLTARPWLEWAQLPIAALQGALGWVNSHASIGDMLGSHAAITMAGCCLGTILIPTSDVRAPADRLRWAGLFAIGLTIAALLLDPLYGLNKIRATPSWCFLCAALTTLAWIGLYWLMDLRGWRRWSRIIQPAGANPLLAYVLHPFLYLLAGLLQLPLDFYHRGSWPLAVNLGGSLVMALVVVQLTGLIVRTGYRMKV
jgi:heparan-alpha-glucosaminide N-acetyltransferase